jgi:hypothetical protein
MQAIMFYRPNSEHETMVTRYLRDLNRQTGHSITMVSVDTQDGVAQAELYDILRFPALVVVKDSGELIQSWQDELLPTINEVSGYLNQ